MIDLNDPGIGEPGKPPAQPAAEAQAPAIAPAASPSPPRAGGTDAAALPPGQRVFEYRIDKLLGGGGFGLTYLAHDVNLELPVALKEYFPGDLASRGAEQSVHVRSEENAPQFDWGLERFLDEARALASFRHPNIARVLRYFKENGTAYIVMEYETGDPLKRWLTRHQPLSRQALLQLVYPLLDGLESVHKMNFLHRDIKPDNIYIRADGSPVLLDFGAARRVTAERDMTNIVSPGFAPFEQYHSKGHQGPWTDIYSLGAVMYWMTTGQKPLEAASRVREDSMPRAADIGGGNFGEGLLRAIDKALSPDEGQRPQTVAEFRALLMDPKDAATELLTRTLPTGNRARVSGGKDVLAFAASSQSVPQNQSRSDALRKNVLGTIMFLDLVAYSTYSTEQQVVAKGRFNELITKALKGVAEESRIVIDTGDGAAVCFLGDPEEALQSALLMRELLLQKYGHALLVRIGLHLGPIRMVFDINNRVNVVGDGINVAQRIMDFAQPNQIVVSRSFYEVVSRITEMAATLFSELGPHLDKHMRSHEIYAVLDPNTAPTHPVAPGAEMGFERTSAFPVVATLSVELANETEAELARLIGPLAKVLVKKAMMRSVSEQGLREMLSVSIPDPAAREAFIKARSYFGQPSQPSPSGRPPVASNTGSDAFAPSRPSGSPVSVPVHSAPSSSLQSGARPSPAGYSRPFEGTRSAPSSASGRDVSRPVNSQPVSLPLQNLTPEQLSLLEKALTQHIGPVARMVIKKESAKHVSMAALLKALAMHIDSQQDRDQFLAAVQKLPLGRG